MEGDHIYHMKADSTWTHLREASSAIERAVDLVEASDVKGRLIGKAEQLRYFIGGDPEDPEAVASPRPDTLDTIQSDITAIMEVVDDDAADHLREARKQLLLTIVTLDDRRRKQHQSFATSNNEE